MAHISVNMKAALDVNLHKRKFFTQYCSIYTFTDAKKDADVEAGNFLGCKGYFAHVFLNLSEKLLCDELSPYECSLGVGTLYFPLPSCQRLANRKSGTWNLVFDNSGKVRWTVQEHCQNQVARSVLLSICLFRSLAFHSHPSCCSQQGTSHLAEVRLKLVCIIL